MKLFYLGLLMFLGNISLAQSDSLRKFSFFTYGELYYSHDFSKFKNKEKADFIYNHKENQELNANLILFKTNYTSKIFRYNLGLMWGNYAQYNLSAEPNWAQFIYEANMSLRLSKKQKIWATVGVMPSHIGFESAISADCWTLTRSILAENSPYYESGLKINYTNKSENLQASLFVLNGWQNIYQNNKLASPALGLQINYKPNESTILNYSNYLGNVSLDSLQATRLFHNFYVQYEPKSKLGVLVGLDIGTQKNNAGILSVWYSPVVICKYNFSEKLKLALRGELYSDKQNIIIPKNNINGFSVTDLSANFDYKINKNLVFRIEGKKLNLADGVFLNNKDSNFSLTTNITVSI